MIMTDNNKKSVSNNRSRRVFRRDLEQDFNKTDFRVEEDLLLNEWMVGTYAANPRLVNIPLARRRQKRLEIRASMRERVDANIRQTRLPINKKKFKDCIKGFKDEVAVLNARAIHVKKKSPKKTVQNELTQITTKAAAPRRLAASKRQRLFHRAKPRRVEAPLPELHPRIKKKKPALHVGISRIIDVNAIVLDQPIPPGMVPQQLDRVYEHALSGARRQITSLLLQRKQGAVNWSFRERGPSKRAEYLHKLLTIEEKWRVDVETQNRIRENALARQQRITHALLRASLVDDTRAKAGHPRRHRLQGVLKEEQEIFRIMISHHQHWGPQRARGARSVDGFVGAGRPKPRGGGVNAIAWWRLQGGAIGVYLGGSRSLPWNTECECTRCSEVRAGRTPCSREGYEIGLSGENA
jgi:hypothetical protein